MGSHPNYQGQSPLVTEAKQRGLSAAFAINLNIFQKKYSGKPYAKYMHFDLNCGCGVNAEVGCIGSPIAFMNQANAIGIERLSAHFVDSNGDAIRMLMEENAIKTDKRAFTHHGDNEPFCSAIPYIVDAMGERKEYAIGSVLSDPNGTKVPFKELAALAEQCPRLDIMINVSATSFKRNFQYSNVRLDDQIASIDKKFWLVREPIGPWQWTIFIGRNTFIGEHKALGFYDMDSPKGRSIVERLTYTAKEISESMDLLQPMLC